MITFWVCMAVILGSIGFVLAVLVAGSHCVGK